MVGHRLLVCQRQQAVKFAADLAGGAQHATIKANDALLRAWVAKLVRQTNKRNLDPGPAHPRLHAAKGEAAVGENLEHDNLLTLTIRERRRNRGRVTVVVRINKAAVVSASAEVCRSQKVAELWEHKRLASMS